MYSNIVSTARLTGIQKAAIIILALDDERVREVLTRFEETTIREVSSAMANIGQVDRSVVEDVINDFITRIGSGSSVSGNLETTEKILLKVLPHDKVSEIMASIRGPDGDSMWDKLSNVNESVLANYLKNEYPQSVALIVSKMNSDHASKVLTHFSENFVLDVMLRVLGIESVQEEILDSVEETLASEFITNLSQTRGKDGHQILADIFNNYDRSTSEQMLNLLETQDFEAAERIRSLMFTFEDLIALESSHLQTLIRNIPRENLTLALKGSPDTIVNVFLTNLSERAGRILREDMQSMGPVRLRIIEESQADIVNIARRLADENEIDLIQGNSKDQYVK